MYTPEQIEIANKTSRNSPAIGAKAITPKMVRKYIEDNNLDKDETLILDFGAGKAAAHAQKFVEDGYNCLAYEFGNNVDPRVHCELALMNQYDIVYASNVLNVQSTPSMLEETLIQVKLVLKPDGVFFANYPLSPRKMDKAGWELHSFLKDHFKVVDRVGGTSQAPLWLLKK
jgi:SAM-dependent methyltransferase